MPGPSACTTTGMPFACAASTTAARVAAGSSGPAAWAVTLIRVAPAERASPTAAAASCAERISRQLPGGAHSRSLG